MNYQNFGCSSCYAPSVTPTTSVVLSGRAIVLAIDDTVLSNGELLNIQIAQDIPDISELTYVPNVVIQVPSLGIFTVIQTVSCDLYGTPNNLYADQLAKITCCSGTVFAPNQILSVKFATDTQCFNYVGVRKPLPRTKGLAELSDTSSSSTLSATSAESAVTASA